MILIAHGIASRADLPIPEWLFAWAAAMVLIVSFIGLAVLWPQPKLAGRAAGAPSRGLSAECLTSRPVEILCGAIGVALLALVALRGLAGVQTATRQLRPDVRVRAVLARAGAAERAVRRRVPRVQPVARAGARDRVAGADPARGEPPKPLPYPERLGHWPAAAGLLCFAGSSSSRPGERAGEHRDRDRSCYSAVTFVAMALYGVEAWCRRGEAFSVYFNLFSRMLRRSSAATAPSACASRCPGCRRFKPGPGIVAVFAVMIGAVTFDGAAEAPIWQRRRGGHRRLLRRPRPAPAARPRGRLRASGCARSCCWSPGCTGSARSARARSAGGFSARELRWAFVHTLVPIALAYVAAHYFTLLLFQGQALAFLASDPAR